MIDTGKLRKVLEWHDLGINHDTLECELVDTAVGQVRFKNKFLEDLINEAYDHIVNVLEVDLPF